MSSSLPEQSVSSGTPAPARRLDAASLIDQVREHAGVALELLGPASGGEVGAAYVGWPDGRQGVLTWWPDSSADSAEKLRRTSELLEFARGRGIPVPAYDLVAEVPGAHAIVQERLPGVAPDWPDGPLLDQLLEANRRCADLLLGRADLPAAELYLTHSGPGFCLHESLRGYDARTGRLLDVVRWIGEESPDRMAGDDLVHLDYHPGNVLVDDAGRLTGIIDWDGISRGDRRFDLVTLRFALTAMPGEPGLVERLDAVLERDLDPEALRVYWAHMSLRLVDWSIRHYGPAEVDHWLRVAAQRLA